jgi:ferredoxin
MNRPEVAADAPARVLHLDWTACAGHGQCAELLPELLRRDELGYPLAVDGGPTRDLPVPPELAAHAERAVSGCPRLALRLINKRA